MSKRNENRPGCKKTKVGWIPEEWNAEELGTHVDIISGNSPAIYHPSNTGVYPFVKVDDMNLCSIYQSSSRLYSSVDRSLIPEGAIIFAKRGAAIATNKVRIAKCPLVIDSNMMALVAKKSIDSLFLYYSIFKEELWKIADTSTIPQINNKHIKPYKIPLPPLPEQKKIAEILSAWDRVIEQVGKLIDAKQRLKKRLMQRLLTGRMRFSGFGKPVREKAGLLEGWKMIRAKKMFERRSVKNCGKETVLSVTQDVGVVPRDSLDRKINMTDSNTDTYKLVEPGDFVISLRSFQGGIEYSKHRGIVSPAYHVIRPTVKVDNDFYRHYFKSYEFVGHLAIAVIGIRDGKQISYDDFAYMRFPYPPVPEQTRIASVLSTCDREIELLLRKEIVLREQKKGLMQKLLTGEIRVKVQENNG